MYHTTTISLKDLPDHKVDEDGVVLLRSKHDDNIWITAGAVLPGGMARVMAWATK